MATLEQKIIDELKLALEYQEPTGDYAQWLMGVSLPSVIERKNDQLVITAIRTRGDGSIVHFAG